ncbi:DUF488 domain-containing protein [Candidatus Woesearchaeota archaeon]|nr:DUF488 domain-containing protein [Candidatus Woesearchaeota archaeon]
MALITMSIAEAKKPVYQDVWYIVRRAPKIENGVWKHQLSPSPLLLHNYHKDFNFDNLRDGYISEITRRACDDFLDLVEQASKSDVRVACYEDDPADCHRSILAEMALNYDPDLEVILE